MLVYSIGHSVIIVIAGTSLELVNKLSESEKYLKIGKVLKVIFGIITLILALYLLYIVF